MWRVLHWKWGYSWTSVPDYSCRNFNGWNVSHKNVWQHLSFYPLHLSSTQLSRLPTSLRPEIPSFSPPFIGGCLPPAFSHPASRLSATTPPSLKKISYAFWLTKTDFSLAWKTTGPGWSISQSDTLVTRRSSVRSLHQAIILGKYFKVWKHLPSSGFERATVRSLVQRLFLYTIWAYDIR